jgi:hypothetical protein
MDEFNRAFNEQMEGGVASYIKSKMTVADGLGEDGSELEYKSDMYGEGNAMYQQLNQQNTSNIGGDNLTITGTTDDETVLNRMFGFFSRDGV